MVYELVDMNVMYWVTDTDNTKLGEMEIAHIPKQGYCAVYIDLLHNKVFATKSLPTIEEALKLVKKGAEGDGTLILEFSKRRAHKFGLDDLVNGHKK